jgi:hypothetical protein
MVEAGSYLLTEESYAVVVGLGGAGGYGQNSGYGNSDGNNGGDSSFNATPSSGDSIIAYGGGGGAKRTSTTTGNPATIGTDLFPGKVGGSSGGGSKNLEVKPGSGGTPFGNIGGILTKVNNYGTSGGGAGGPGAELLIKKEDNPTRSKSGGPGRLNDITGEPVMYAVGGCAVPPISNTSSDAATRIPGLSGAANTGNGGSGAWNGSGGNGGSGVVIVRFLARPNSTSLE